MRTLSQNNNWNRYETALLIDTYISINSGKAKKRVAILTLSERLRKRMLLNGIAINDTYRNVSSILLQMSAIDYLFSEGMNGIKRSNEVFDEVFNLYKTSSTEFNSLVTEAERMYPLSAVSKPNEFTQQEVKSQTYKIEKPENNTLNEPHVTDQADITLERINSVLAQYYSRGFRLDSVIELQRFRHLFNGRYNESINLGNDVLTQKVSSCGIICNNKVYLPDRLMPVALRETIKSFIEKEFSANRPCVYYTVLYESFKDRLLETMISDIDMLRSCLQFFFSGTWHFSDDAICKTQNQTVDVNQEVINFIREQGRVVSKEEVIKSLGFLPVDEVKTAFSSNRRKLVSCGNNLRFHIDLFVISKQEIDVIRSIIDDAIRNEVFLPSKVLFERINERIPSLMSNNMSIPELGIRNAIANIFEDSYSCNGPIISSREDDLNAGEALLKYVKRKRDFTLDDIKLIADSLNPSSLSAKLESILRYSLRINEETFVNRDGLRFDIENIDKAIGRWINPKGYQPIRQVTSFAVFPDCEFPWNLRLLESYLLTYSKKYTLLFNMNLALNSVSGAIVEKGDTRYQSLDDVLVIDLIDSGTSLNKDAALDFFVYRGFITRRKYKNISDVLSRAKMNNNK